MLLQCVQINVFHDDLLRFKLIGITWKKSQCCGFLTSDNAYRFVSSDNSVFNCIGNNYCGCSLILDEVTILFKLDQFTIGQAVTVRSGNVFVNPFNVPLEMILPTKTSTA